MLALGAELTYINYANGNDKYYRVIMFGNRIYTQYGRRGSETSPSLKTFDTLDLAAADMWKTLRSKVGKGYAVVDAAVFNLNDELVDNYNAAYGNRDSARMVIGAWKRLQNGERATSRRALMRHPDLQVRSPRTPLQGKFLIMDLINETCSEDLLLSCAMADPSERFLPPIALSHPACTDTVRVAGFLIDTAISPE